MNHLKPLKVEAHGHAPEEEKPVGKKKKKTEGNLKLESMVGKMMTEAQFDEAAGKKDGEVRERKIVRCEKERCEKERWQDAKEKDG